MECEAKESMVVAVVMRRERKKERRLLFPIRFVAAIFTIIFW